MKSRGAVYEASLYTVVLRFDKSHNGTETETPSLALGVCEFHQSYFRPIKHLN